SSGQNHFIWPGGFETGLDGLEHHHLRVAGRDHLEFDYVVVRAAFEFESCVDWWIVRFGAGSVRGQLARDYLVATEQRTLVAGKGASLESHCSHGDFADCRICSRIH